MKNNPNVTQLPRAATAQPHGDRLLRQAEVQAMLGAAKSTVEQWRLKGQGPKFVKIGRSVRYRFSDVTAYIAGLEAFGSTTEADHAA
ncbi:helix-turn-helix domain-containing protein [Geomonas subterranea]|uniref:Helix-turn-helix domain-containing protein n=1 Tax=Geomonas subterranea TaxID=2847989 RepID=A0ABX8LC81_9BACT|nr:helix-turn-helix domain-containing protein [Geomonas subterranea]QXE89631.1 helix-turn-helix domain-containing protein [Geomonas subterranea]QXM08253.1 helix-turn-helix domain-containing protein [Geomonas subterranea]